MKLRVYSWKPTPKRVQAQQENAPTCPICGGEMRRQMAKKGVNAGHDFWGCINYPQCKGTRAINPGRGRDDRAGSR